MAEVDIESLERQAARRASAALRSSIVAEVGSTFSRRSGLMARSSVQSRFRDGRLDRLALVMPHYSFKLHFGSDKRGNTPSTTRRKASVKEFRRTVLGVGQTVRPHERGGGSVRAHVKNINYRAFNHIARAMSRTNALEQLATDLSENRAVVITSQIQF